MNEQTVDAAEADVIADTSAMWTTDVLAGVISLAWMCPPLLARLGAFAPLNVGNSAFHPVLLHFGLYAGLLTVMGVWLWHGKGTLLVRASASVALSLVLPWSAWHWTRESLSRPYFPLSRGELLMNNLWLIVVGVGAVAAVAICIVINRSNASRSHDSTPAEERSMWHFSLAELFAFVSSIASVCGAALMLTSFDLPAFVPLEEWDCHGLSATLLIVCSAVCSVMIGCAAYITNLSASWSYITLIGIVGPCGLSIILAGGVTATAALLGYPKCSIVFYASMPALAAEFWFVAAGMWFLRSIKAID